MKHGRTRKYLKSIAAVGGLMIALSACAPSATYPPVETTARLAKPTFEPVPTVIATAIRYVRDTYTKDQDLAINLPPGVPAEAYDKVFDHLGGGRPMIQADEKAIHVTEVRTRNFNAQVDLVYPRPDGLNQFVTITMKRSVLENYHVERVRPWQLRDVAVMTPNYQAPPIEEEESVAMDEELIDDSVVVSPTDEEPTPQE